MVKKLFVVVILALIVLLAGCASPQPTEKTTLKIGSLPRIFDLIAYAAKQEGLFEKQKINVEIVSFRSTVEMNSALLAGQLDGIIQDVFEVVNINKEGVKVKIVGWSTMPRMFEIVVSPVISSIVGPSDLKGKEVATGTGTIMDYALDRLLTAEGVDPKSITKVNVPSMPLRLEVVTQGKVPAAILSPPLSDVALLNGGRLILDDTKQPFAGPGLVFTTDALKNKSDAISRCIKAWQESVDLINTNPEKYRSLLIEVARISEPVSKSIKMPVFSRLRLPTEAEIKPIADWMISQGQMTRQPDYNEIVETKYLK